MENKIFDLVKELERLEHTLVFTVFYSFAEFMESDFFFTPAFEVDAYYYEVQEDNEGELRVLRFYRNQEDGEVLSLQELESLILELKEIEAVKDISTNISAFKRIGKHEGTVVTWFQLGESYNLIVEDECRNTISQIVSKEELNEFLEIF